MATMATVATAPPPHKPSSLKALLSDVYTRVDADPSKTPWAVLRSILKKSHCLSELQIKGFASDHGVVMLHTTLTRHRASYKSKPVFYNKFKSAIIDLHAPIDEGIIAIKTRHILNDTTYETLMLDTDVCERRLRGIEVHVYHNRDKWLFSTNGCTDMDLAWFKDKDVRIGTLFDEALDRIGMTRSSLTNMLPKDKVYTFKIVTDHDGEESMTRIYHSDTCFRCTMETTTTDDTQLKDVGVLYPERFASPMAALEWFRSAPDSNGLIVHSVGVKNRKIVLRGRTNVV